MSDQRKVLICLLAENNNWRRSFRFERWGNHVSHSAGILRVIRSSDTTWIGGCTNTVPSSEPSFIVTDSREACIMSEINKSNFNILRYRLVSVEGILSTTTQPDKRRCDLHNHSAWDLTSEAVQLYIYISSSWWRRTAKYKHYGSIESHHSGPDFQRGRSSYFMLSSCKLTQ